MLCQNPPRKNSGLVGIRTPGQSVKSRLLYLAELQAHQEKHREKQEQLFRLNDTNRLLVKDIHLTYSTRYPFSSSFFILLLKSSLSSLCLVD